MTDAANDMTGVIEADRAHIWHHLIQHKPFETIDPRIIVEGKGMRGLGCQGQGTSRRACRAGSGRSTWAMAASRIAKAVYDQLVKMNYFAGSAGSIPGSHFAKRLIEKMPGLTRVYYSNSGSEANEKVYKMVRQIAHRHHGGKKYKILYRERDYHGTTITALSIGRSAGAGDAVWAVHARFRRGAALPGIPQAVGCRELWRAGGRCHRGGDPARGSRYRRRAGAGAGDGGRRRDRAAGGATGSGFRRSARNTTSCCTSTKWSAASAGPGTWFGYQHYGIKPDFVTMAKGVASGYAAISCTVTTEAVFEHVQGRCRRTR